MQIKELAGDAADAIEELSKRVPPVPHGRLIDADALREDWLENGENEYVYDTNAFLDSLDSAPTIIPAEEAPAEDINVPGTYDILYEEGEI